MCKTDSRTSGQICRWFRPIAFVCVWSISLQDPLFDGIDWLAQHLHCPVAWPKCWGIIFSFRKIPPFARSQCILHKLHNLFARWAISATNTRGTAIDQAVFHCLKFHWYVRTFEDRVFCRMSNSVQLAFYLFFMLYLIFTSLQMRHRWSARTACAFWDDRALVEVRCPCDFWRPWVHPQHGSLHQYCI